MELMRQKIKAVPTNNKCRLHLNRLTLTVKKSCHLFIIISQIDLRISQQHIIAKGLPEQSFCHRKNNMNDK